MSKKIKILTPRIYEHSDFFHNAVDFAREHSLNTNELCLELSHYLVDNFEKIWKVEKPRIYKKIADLEAKLAESEKYNKMLLEEKSGYIDLISGYSKKCKNYKQQLNSDHYKLCPRCNNPYGASQFPSKDENGKEIYVCSNCNEKELFYEPLIKQLEDQNDRLIKERDDANLKLSKLLQRVSEQNEELADLKAKLAEKEERIEIARNVKQARIDSLELDKKICEEHKQIIFNQLLEKCKKAEQDKISFAVEKLQYLIDEEFEVEYLNDYNSEAKIEYVPCEKIENLIKQLKEGK